jgi:hypothetical protein
VINFRNEINDLQTDFRRPPQRLPQTNFRNEINGLQSDFRTSARLPHNLRKATSAQLPQDFRNLRNAV